MFQATLTPSLPRPYLRLHSHMHHLCSRAAKLAAFSLLVSTAFAQGPVGLGKHGPVDPANGFPGWYQDVAPTGDRAVALELMTNVIPAPNPNLPIVFPTNFPDEVFYFMSHCDLSDGANGAFFEGALEGTFMQGIPVAGEHVVFSRIRMRIDGLQSGATYTIRHPFGTESIVAAGGRINITRDITPIPGNFAAALSGDVGPFLVPASMTDAQIVPGAMIGDGTALTQVRRGVNGQNFVEIEGPGIELAYPTFAGVLGDNKIRHDLFTLTGKVASRIGASVDQAYYSRKALAGTSVNVWSTSASGQSLRVSANSGTAAAPIWGAEVPMVENAGSGEYFARMALGVANPPAQVRVVNYSDVPPTVVVSQGAKISDLVTVEKAVFSSTGVLTIRARSSDEVTPPVRYTAETTTGGGVLGSTGSLTGIGTAIFEGTVTIPNSFAPSRVSVVSSNGASADVPVEVDGVGTPVAATVTAMAGADQSALGGVLVTLSGADSLGPVTHYEWTQVGGPAVTLTGAQTATATFVAPLTLNGDLTFQLLVSQRDATGLVLAQDAVGDTVVITISNPQLLNPDVLTMTDARYDRQKVSWRAAGTARQLANQTVKLYLGNATAPDYARFVGEATVSATGAWTFAGGNGTAPANTRAPITGVTNMWAVSMFRATAVPNQNTPARIAFRVN